MQIAFISITKDAALPNVPDFNEALTLVFTSVSSVQECTSAAVGPTTPQTPLFTLGIDNFGVKPPQRSTRG